MNPADSNAARARQKRARILLAVIGVLLIAVLTAFIFANNVSDWNAPPEAKVLTNPLPRDPALIAAGKALYQERCANCHGDSGNGKGNDSWKYWAKPADFSDASAMNKMTDGELFWKITAGRKPMPSFETKLSEDERWMLVDYIRTFSQPSAPADSK
jgi:mono/diheme cytochrome c family protein